MTFVVIISLKKKFLLFIAFDLPMEEQEIAFWSLALLVFSLYLVAVCQKTILHSPTWLSRLRKNVHKNKTCGLDWNGWKQCYNMDIHWSETQVTPVQTCRRAGTFVGVAAPEIRKARDKEMHEKKKIFAIIATMMCFACCFLPLQKRIRWAWTCSAA